MVGRITFFLVCISLVLRLSSNAAGVSSVDLIVLGSGVTFSDAVNEALTEAIARKSGRSVATQTDLKSIVSSVTSADGSKGVASEILARNIQTATKGEVLGYEVLEEGKDEHALVTVKLRVRMAEYLNSVQADRIRIGIPKVRVPPKDHIVGEQVEAAAKSTLTDTRKFAVVDRNWESEYAEEMALLIGGTAARAEKARVGQRLGADLLLIISVQQVQISATNNAGSLLSSSGSAVCNYNLIEAATGLVKTAKTFTASINQAQARSAGGDLGQIAVLLANSIGRRLGELVVESAYPLMIVSIDDQEVAVNQGGDRMKIGQAYEIFALGDKVQDPQTGEELGRAEKLIGKAILTRVTPKISYAKIEEKSREIEVGMLLRKLAKSSQAAPTKPTLNTTKDW